MRPADGEMHSERTSPVSEPTRTPDRNLIDLPKFSKDSPKQSDKKFNFDE